MLEVIDKAACRESGKAPLLFVHGAWHGSWCWDEYFLDFFADKGYRSLAVSLRGHGKSPAPKPMQFCSMADYVDDVDSVARSLPRRPVLVGHSMGGFVVQKYLESHDAPAAVLLASAPVNGIAGFLLRRFRRHPWLTATELAKTKSLRAKVSSRNLLPMPTWCATPRSLGKSIWENSCSRCCGSTGPNLTLSLLRCWSWGPKTTLVSRSTKSTPQHVPTTPKQKSSPRWAMT